MIHNTNMFNSMARAWKTIVPQKDDSQRQYSQPCHNTRTTFSFNKMINQMESWLSVYNWVRQWTLGDEPHWSPPSSTKPKPRGSTTLSVRHQSNNMGIKFLQTVSYFLSPTLHFLVGLNQNKWYTKPNTKLVVSSGSEKRLHQISRDVLTLLF